MKIEELRENFMVFFKDVLFDFIIVIYEIIDKLLKKYYYLI